MKTKTKAILFMDNNIPRGVYSSSIIRSLKKDMSDLHAPLDVVVKISVTGANFAKKTKEYEKLLTDYLKNNDIVVIYGFFARKIAVRVLKLHPELGKKCIIFHLPATFKPKSDTKKVQWGLFSKSRAKLADFFAELGFAVFANTRSLNIVVESTQKQLLVGVGVPDAKFYYPDFTTRITRANQNRVVGLIFMGTEKKEFEKYLKQVKMRVVSYIDREVSGVKFLLYAPYLTEKLLKDVGEDISIVKTRSKFLKEVNVLVITEDSVVNGSLFVGKVSTMGIPVVVDSMQSIFFSKRLLSSFIKSSTPAGLAYEVIKLFKSSKKYAEDSEYSKYLFRRISSRFTFKRVLRKFVSRTVKK